MLIDARGAVAAGEAIEGRLARFAGFLRANGFGVGSADALQVVAAAERIGALDPRIMRWSLKALLCARGDEWRRFDALFDAYFLPPNRKAFVQNQGAGAADPRAIARGRDPAPVADDVAQPGAAGNDDAVAARRGASREDALASVDFRDLDKAEHARDIEALMRRFARRLKHLRLRRERSFHRGRRLDLRRTVRRSIGSGGTPFRLAWSDHRRVRPRLVLLLDVSRSMSAYSFFYLRLARALTAELTDVHCFIFHTRLTGVSEALRDPDPWRSQERLHLLSAGWGGGTRIGECLQAFNRDHAPRLVHSRTALVIVSDGYDTGEPSVLSAAMSSLARRARRIVWLNPLLSAPGYTPESRGMQAALPHVDLFAPGADLASVEHILPQLVDTLR